MARQQEKKKGGRRPLRGAKTKATRKPKAKKVLVKKSTPSAKIKRPVSKTKKKPTVSRAKPDKKKPSVQPAKKPVARVKTVKPTARKASPAEQTSPILSSTPPPGPLPLPIVSKPTEELIGTVTHYYSDLGVAVAQTHNNILCVGDTIHIKGHTTDFQQSVASIEVDHKPVTQVSPGDLFGLKVLEQTREHDQIYKVNH